MMGREISLCFYDPIVVSAHEVRLVSDRENSRPRSVCHLLTFCSHFEILVGEPESVHQLELMFLVVES